jgi:predicted PurR-regulated permease PerM
MTLQKQVWFWLSTFIVFIGFIWLLSDILLPFVLGAAIAYLLEPITKYLTDKGLARWLASLTILFIFFVLVATLFVLISPVIYRETLKLADALPGYIEQLWLIIQPYTLWLQNQFGNGESFEFQDAIKEHAGKAIKVGVNVLESVVNGGQALTSLLTLFIFTPIVAFFMIKEWPTMLNWVDKQIPRHSQDKVHDLLRQIDSKISGFVRGQITVAFLLGAIYAIALFIAGLNFGFLIGLLAGFLSIIPLVGSTIGLLVSVTVAWLQSAQLSYVGAIAAIFIVGQFVEGNFITPRLLGKSVGMHALWILFALMAGGTLFGLVGMLLAVPIAASFGVLIGFALEEYRKSPYYDKSLVGKKQSTRSKKSPKQTKA